MITTIYAISDFFERGNVMVFGEKGSGKDLLFGNVIARRDSSYISNCDYQCKREYIPLDFDLLDCGKNTYLNLISKVYRRYKYPYPEGCDIYISDCGIIFPSQYNADLDKRYPYLPTFFALSRHLGDCRVHLNTQDVSRPWNKLREQSSTYIRCMGVNKLLLRLFGLVVMDIIIYDKYDSALARVKPCRIDVPLFASSEAKMSAQLYRDKFYNTYGRVQRETLIFFNKCKYDSRFYKKVFEDGVL